MSNSEQTTAAPRASLSPHGGESACMIARTQWIESLTCPNCGMSGSACLSQPGKRAYDFSVEAIPVGFKVVRLQFGDAFFCEACNLQAHTR
jgi:hypothetical protein